MASSFPGALDSFTNPTSTDAMDASAALYHDVQHANINDAVEAVQAELGTDPAGAQATVKARLEAAQWWANSSGLYWPSGGYTLAGPVSAATATSTSVALDSLQFQSWWCPADVTLDRVAVEVTTLQAGANARLGIYSATSTGAPDALVVDLGEVDCSSTGVKELTVSQAVTGGVMYWLAVLNEINNVGYRAVPVNSTRPLAVGSTAGTVPIGRLYVDRTYTSGFLSTVGTPSLTTNAILFWLRRT
jgi:hypothetical protein